MTLLGLALECAAVGAVLATAMALVSLAATSLFSGRSAALRADAAFVAAVAPALLVVVALAATLIPSVPGLLGGPMVDHCDTHGHHPHLCLAHFAGLRPAAALLGAMSLVFAALRAGALVARASRLRRTVLQLEALAVSDAPRLRTPSGFAVLEVPGAARVCHAVGVLRRRVIVSAQTRTALTPRGWDAVQAHEDAHLARRDPLATLLVDAALVLVPPILAGALRDRFRRDVEHACDDAAARRLGDAVTVAAGLIEAARVLGRSRPSLDAPAATAQALEARVCRLLNHGPGPARPPRAFAAGAVLVAALAVGAACSADIVHHALETVLSVFS